MAQDAPPLTARQEQGTRSREEILDAAERLMGARGYAATSISALSKECGLPASSIYWHFGSKSGVLGAVMERGSRRFFAAADAARLPDAAEPRDRLAVLLQLSAQAVHAHPQFLRLFIVLLLGSEGEHAQHDVVARVRAEGERLLRQGLAHCYAPWGEAVALRISAGLGDVALALFDGVFISGQATESYDAALVGQAVAALHSLAEAIRSSGPP
jgi:AcrR family transcriptional regulator